MLRYALRRALWILPTLVVVTLVAFGLLSRIPSSGLDQPLPALLNPRPRDVRSLAEASVDQLARQLDQQQASEQLARLGTAALPFVLPRFDALSPEQRARVALALEPVARRMGLFDPASFADGSRAVVFWQRFWEERSIEYKTPVVRRAVRRLVAYGSEARRTELIELDTFALQELIEALGEVRTTQDVERVARLLEVAAHVTGRGDAVPAGAGPEEAERCATRWRQWWLDAHSDYVVLAGPGRLAAMVLETRYGRWALGASSLRLGTGPDGTPVLDALAQRGVTTVALALCAQLLASLFAVAPGLLSAWKRGSAVDHLPAGISLALYGLTPALLAAIAGAIFGARFVIAAGLVAVALGLVASPMRHTRVAAHEAIVAENVRAARARGASAMRLLWSEVAPIAAVALVAISSVEFPFAFTATCIAERVLGVSGITGELARAVLEGNLPLLMAFAVCSAAIAGAWLVAADLACAWLDPRCRSLLIKERS